MELDIGIVTKELRKMVADILEINPEEVKPEANFVEDLGMDSMMALEILAMIEKKYKLKIPETELTKMSNLSQVIELVEKYSK